MRCSRFLRCCSRFYLNTDNNCNNNGNNTIVSWRTISGKGSRNSSYTLKTKLTHISYVHYHNLNTYSLHKPMRIPLLLQHMTYCYILRAPTINLISQQHFFKFSCHFFYLNFGYCFFFWFCFWISTKQLKWVFFLDFLSWNLTKLNK